jgi:integrase
VKAPCFVKEIKMNIVEPIRSKKDLKKIENILKKQSLRDLLIFTIGTNCGLRISDILNLNVGDVRGKTYINIIEKKTSKPKRFPINIKLKPLFEEFTQGRRDNEPLFLSYLNNRMERTQCYRIIRDVCKEAGIEYKVGTHTLRKTFGYHHYQKFHDVAVLQKIFNHYSPQITLRYIGIDQDMIDESYNNFIL